MRIVVAGCGYVGENLISDLADEGHDVIVLDSSSGVVSDMTNRYDVMGVCGNAADYETLESAGAGQCDLFVASTSSDELNMLSCFIAKRIGARYTVARIRNPEYNDDSLGFMKRELGLAMAVNPEEMAARELYDLLKLPSAAKIETFSGRAIEIVELKMRENSPLAGLSLKELGMMHKARVLICTVQREGEVYIPGGDFVLNEGDRIGITASPSEIEMFLRQFGLMKRKSKDVMILGGGRTSYYLAKMLLAGGSAVKIIEKDHAMAKEIAEALPEATVIQGDSSNREILLEEGLPVTDAFVALTESDEKNILMSMFAETQNVSKVIAAVDRDEMEDMAEKIGIDTVISPKKIVSDLLVRYARALANTMESNVETMYKLMDDKVEALEFSVRQPSKNVTGIPLKDLRTKKNILIAGIIRGRKTIVPGGNDIIKQGDRVVVLAYGHRLSDIEDIVE